MPLKNWKRIYLYGLLLCLISILAGTGCSKGLLKKEPEAKIIWTCDNDADEAMVQQDYETGILLHKRFLEIKPANAFALYHIGYAHGQLGNYLKEISYYEEAIELGFEQKEIFFNLGMAYLELDQIKKSIRCFNRILEINPKNADGYFGLGLVHKTNIDYRLAQEEFLKALDIDHDHIDARLQLSILYSNTGKLKEAERQLQIILEIDPTNTAAQKFLENIRKE